MNAVWKEAARAFTRRYNGINMNWDYNHDKSVSDVGNQSSFEPHAFQKQVYSVTAEQNTFVLWL
jgi:hypothetical protein